MASVTRFGHFWSKNWVLDIGFRRQYPRGAGKPQAEAKYPRGAGKPQAEAKYPRGAGKPQAEAKYPRGAGKPQAEVKYPRGARESITRNIPLQFSRRLRL